MARDAQRPRHGARRLDLARVPLAVPDGQRVQLEPLALRDGGGGVGVEPATQ